LRAAHEVGIVHRDVKPGNVLITDDGSAKLTDFGISHAAGDVTLTSTGMVSGTPAYLAPEVARGGASGFAADVFSLGATMYAALEGAPPFGLDTNPMAVLHRVASGQLIPPKQSGPLTPLLLAMMASNPADRPTMAEVSRALNRPAIVPVPPAPATTAAGRPAPPPTGQSAQTLPVSRAELAAGLAASDRRAEPGKEPAAREPAAQQPAAQQPAAQQPAVQQPAALAALMAAPHTGSAAPETARRRRPAILVAAGAVILVAILTAGYFLLSGQDGGQGSTAAPAANTEIATSPAPESLAVTTDVEQTEESETTTASEAEITASAAETTASAAETTASAAETTPGSAEAAALTAAVTDYYALMPSNTDAGWARLTPGFQSGIAQNRDYYNSFWGGVESVAVTDAVGTPPGTVEATITYTFTDGTQSVERTQYQLVRDGAELKIDNSTVVS
ncbi:MAG: protein kinase, partial [Nakamurella sp.]